MLDLSRLSLPQRQAVLAGHGPLLILAGPGSGKTTVLAARIAYAVIARSVPPDHILALAFARKAARELAARLSGILGSHGQGVIVTTFHAWGLRLIRQWQRELGYDSGPLSVYDAQDAQLLLHEIAIELGVDLRQQTLAELMARVTRYRLRAAAVSDGSVVQGLTVAYEEALRERQAVDFAAMLTLPLRLFETCSEARHAYQTAYDLVACDEGQDVCPVQYALLKHIVADRYNLTLVGDPAQTIFGWRGANAEALRDFPTDFPTARVLHLQQNFRSTQRIVTLANALSAPLPWRQPLYTVNATGEPVQLHAVRDECAEARFVATEIARLRDQRFLRHVGEAAVLYRTNRQALAIVLALREHGLPYHVRGRGDLLARRDVRNALAYLRLAYNPADQAAWQRTLHAGLGNHPIKDIQLLISRLHAASRRQPPHLLLDLALDLSGYRQWLAQQHDAEARLESLAELRQLLVRVDGGLGEWLTALAMDDEDAISNRADAVTLSTVHAAKGCEWRVVFVVGLEEALLPHAHALAPDARPEALDEERRLAYVAVTRPQERLYLTWRRTRRSGADTQTSQPSRFLAGLPVERV